MELPPDSVDDQLPEQKRRKALEVKARAFQNDRHPDLLSLRSVTLREGPRSRKEAKYLTIRNRHTGEVHHDALMIQIHRKRGGRWQKDPKHSISISNEKSDEIGTLIEFLSAVRQDAFPNSDAEYLVIQAPTDQMKRGNISQLLQQLSSEQQLSTLAELLQRLNGQPDILPVLIEQVARNPQVFTEAVATLKLATYQHAVAQLEHLVAEAEHVTEHQFQALLEEHPWMFGSEYSELLNRRRWTRDEQTDFVVRRTSDGYLELIEIKTPLSGNRLFRHDPSHNSYFASTDLSKVIGQVQKYLETLDHDRHRILAIDHEDTLKIRAKIIIGRDGDADQQQALRVFNGHLYRIEVITFDQLLRIARNVLHYLEETLRPPVEAAQVAVQVVQDDEDIPF